MLDRDALWDLQIFRQVVDAGSLAGAARALRLTPSAVSKRLAHLERRLGVRLLQRSTRRLSVTLEGAALRERSAAVFEALEAAERSIEPGGSALRGRLRVSAPTLFGQEVIAPLVTRFCLAHPGVSVELETSDRFADLVGEGLDVAIRIAARLPSSSLRARKLVELEWVLVAAPELWGRHRRPPGAGALGTLPCLDSAGAGERGHWRLRAPGGDWEEVAVRGPLVATGLAALRHAALGGLGLAQLPRWFVAGDLAARRLEVVLPRWRLQPRLVFAVAASGSLMAPRARALIDHLAASLRGFPTS